MKNRIKKIKAGRMLAGIVITALLSVVLWAAKASDAFAYNFVKGGAEETGTVTVSVRSGAAWANGYSTLGGYRVTYTITRGDWTGFDDRFGGFFIVGNDMDVNGGCQFAYHTSGGEIWEDGAVTLGHLKDGRQIARCDVASGTVSCSFDVNSLEEIPAYIAYVYEPASSAYIHINSDMGMNAHVWYYKSLKDVPVIGNDGIDTEGPVLTSSVIPTGTTADVGGKIWSTGARIQLRAEDGKSRPGGIRIYKDGNPVHEKDNPGNEVILETGYDVNENGSFQADAYDKLNNVCDKISVNISCIDRQAPDIRALKPETTDYVRETRLAAEASDAGCGLHALAYRWNGGAWTDKKEFKVTANGVYTLKIRDALGNESGKNITISNIDREGPEISRTITRTGRMATYRGVLWSTEAEISAQAVDGKSGVEKIRVLNGKNEVEAEFRNTGDKKTDTLQLEGIKIKNGSYKIWASDTLGNTAVTESFELNHVDGDAPVIKEMKTTSLEDGSVLLTVAAEDGEDGIGLDDEAYSFDGGKTWQKEAFITIRENGVYEVLVRDRLYQEASEEKEITEVSVKEKPDHKDEGDKKTDTEEPDHKDKEKPDGQEPDHKDKEEPDGQEPDHKDKEEPDGQEPGNTEESDRQGAGEENPGKEPDESNPAINPSVNSGGTTTPGQNTQKTTGTHRSGKRTGQAVESASKESRENSVSENDTGDTVAAQKRVIPEKILKDAEEKVLSQISPGENQRKNESNSKKEQIVRKTILFILIALFAAGCVGLILYLLLFYLRYSCVLYGIEENQKKHRICRLPLKEKEEEWQVVVPDHKLGLQGIGKYLLVFHPSFVKEEAPAFVIIQIDGKALREKLEEEIFINI